MIRIHNRFLKNRFERCVREATAKKGRTRKGERSEPAASPAACSTSVAAATTTTVDVATEEQMVPPKDGSCCSPCSQGSQTYELSTSGGRVGPGVEGLDQSVEEVCCRGGSGVLTDGDAWRRQMSGALGEFEKCDPASSDEILPTEASPNRQAVEHADKKCKDAETVPPDFVNDINNDNKCDRGGESEGSTGADVCNSGGRSSAYVAKKSDRRSTSLRTRSLEYLFFTGKRGGTVLDCCTNTGEGNEDNSNANERKSRDSKSHQPDLLKLAEDGFYIPDWSETNEPSVSTTTANAELSPSDERYSKTGAVGADTRGKRCFCQQPQAIVLSSHLNKDDIPGVNGEQATVAAAPCKQTSAVAPPASVGEGNREIVSPVCRVLVVKVYTGQSRYLALRSDDRSGTKYRPPQPGLLREAWATGFKSVCVSPVGNRKDGVNGGGGGGNKGAGDGGSSKSATNRYQVRY